ncbi:ATP phosphoribosyltransferase regulatory subunit [Pseudoflavonifractor sp. MSJ-37]|uniref:ATP phosphoribosyltransferase regulatory subunit n=1 Tax=Pseudoflavonifractor sp. MSJ-37 TaxID=2841531 RepID=UPI001C11C030|nr:ATP phosphoribosyltransferase regulatory subunit [Pseudoflavonifractor sp. MSJ-37]MBU5435064.1 ATP phosphoribosyltransferase regulatory subunit [Pseudoflavonifractor sp. MSJ-37]
MTYTINTPEGTRDRLFAECRDRRSTQTALTDLFYRRGYAEVSTPEVEFYDLFLRSGSPLPQESMLKIIDRSGKIMVMRPDCTAPIARVAATKLKTLPLPQRLYYAETVFRSGDQHRGGSSEIAQCGVELIGAAGKKADLEIVAMAVDALRSCGLARFHIELGHAGFFRSLADRMDLEEDQVEELRSLIEGKNFAALGDFLEPYQDRPATAALLRLSRLFGGAEVLDEAEALAGENEAIAYLRELYEALCGAGYGKYLRFDLGLVHQIDYYTGVVFRGYVEGAGDAVLSGGRYDSLVASFGRSAPATGFAVDVDAVAACRPGTEAPRVGTLIHFAESELDRALTAVDGRAAGTCELSPCETLEETLALARRKGAGRVLVLDPDGERTVEV